MEDNCGLAADHETGVYHDEEDDGRLDDGAGERDELSEVGVIARPQKSDNPGEQSKKMPKRRMKFGRSQKRGGNRKLGFGGDGLEYVPPVRGTSGVVAVTNDTQLSLKYIPKKTLLRQLQQIETQCELAQGQVARHSAKINTIQSENRYLAQLAQERRRDLIREERKWIQVVSDVEARADNRVNEALSSVLESEVKTQRLVKAAEHSCKRKIAKISRSANNTINKLQTDRVSLQNQCDQMKSTHAADLATMKIKYTSVIKDQQSELQRAKIKYKSTVREQQRRHSEHIEKHKDEMNSLRELIHGQNDMIEGCVEEFRDERRKSIQASKLVAAKEDIALSRLQKMKMWKNKCEELSARENEFAQQSIEMEELEIQLLEYELIIEEMTEEYEATIHSMYPRMIEKTRVKNRTNNYGHQEWRPHVDKLIIEMLCHRTPPTCIQSVMVAFSKVIFPGHNIIRELPSLRHIRNCRITLLRTTKTLAAYQLGKQTSWKQLHTDETGRRQKQLVNVVISIINEGGDFKSICLSGSIIAEDSTAEEQSRSIIASFGEAGQLLREWKDVTLEMFPQRQDLIDMIPDPSDMSPTKLLGGMVSTDTCNTARLTRQTLCDAIIQEGRDAGLAENELHMYQGNCHQHLRNILVDAGANHLSSKLTQLLCDDLSIIPPHLRVTCNISHILRACDKEFAFTANYAKGHGSMFHAWMETFRPGSLFVPVVRVLNGNRQDASFEGAFPLYVGRSHMVAFLNERLCAGLSENILQRNLFIILESSEMIAQLRICSIFFLTIIVPMRWLASNTFKLSHHKWGEKSMGRVIDLVYDAFVAIQADGTLILDYDFMMGIFGDLQTELPEFNTYMTWYFEEKESNPIGSSSKAQRVLSVDKGTEMLFYPTEKQNMQTDDMCSTLAAGLASCLILELEDPRKANSDYLSVKGGKYSWAKVSDADKDACMGMKAVNDPSEAVFATFTEALSTAGRVGLDGAAGQGQARYNNDMGRAHESMVSGRRGKEQDSNAMIGIFHQLAEELTDSLIVTGRRHGKATRQDFNRRLRLQEEKSEQKEKLAKEKKLKASMEDFMNASYLHQQYNSPRCSMTAVQAFREFEKLTSNAARYRYLKEQILIRYVGLGWEEAYHPWSKGGYIYTPNELLQHLTMVVIPLQRKLRVPEHPPMNLPTRPSLPTLGTKASDIVDMDLQSTQQNTQLRIDAYKERERLEEEGIGDQLSELQQFSWKIFDSSKLKSSPWGIDMLCEYVDDECERTYVWCQGKVVELVRQTDTEAVVKIKWNEACLQPGDPKVTRHVLKKSKWNPQKKDAWKTKGAWREDLLHMIK